MTLEEFMTRFEEVASKYHWLKDDVTGCIRTMRERWCPMQVVYAEVFSTTSQNGKHDEKLGLESLDISRIICAADWHADLTNWVPELRARFLKATNLED